jgi:hypothetical protein
MRGEPAVVRAAWHRALVLVGLRRTADSVPLFRTWHSYAALAIAVAVLVIGRLIWR